MPASARSAAELSVAAVAVARRIDAAPVDLKTWVDLGRNRMIVLLLSITALQMSGQFIVFTFMGPLLKKLTEAGADSIGLIFVLYGVFGFVGILIATRIVDGWGAYKTSILFNALVLTAGIAGWALSAGSYLAMAIAVSDVGTGLRRGQFDAAGAARCGFAAARIGIGVAQYVGALCRAGDRLVRRRSVL